MITDDKPNGIPQGALLSNPGCQATRTDGEACRAHPSESGYCFFHDPERREALLSACSRGGSRRAVPLPIDRPLEASEARGVLASVLGALLQGALDPSTARAAAYILQVERKIAEGEELEKRLAYLEAAVHGQKALGEPVFDAELTGGDFSPELADD